LGSFLSTNRQLVAAHFDGETRAATVSVAHDVGESFVNGTDNGAGVGVLKVHNFGGALNGGANEAQRFRIALQLKFQKHFGLWLGLSATLNSVFGHPSAAHSYTRPRKSGVGTPLCPGCPAGRQCHVPRHLTTEKF
jgi:hypothetical protein